jgi:hypothetical protein
MNRVVFLGVACLVAATLAGPGAGRATERLALSYELWKGGFHALDLDAGLERDDGSYSVSFTAHTRGLIGWIYPYVLEGEADGKLGSDGPRPERFATLARSSGDELRRAISYHGDGTLATWSDPPRAPGDDDATVVPVPLRRDTLDPASAIVAVMEAMVRAGRCDGAYPVYDGRRRYDLTVALVGPSPLSPSRYSSYSGPATLCRVEVSKLAGFKDQRGGGTLPAAIDVWLAPVVGGQPAVPVRLQGDSALGNLLIHLVGAKLEPAVELSLPRAAAR